MGAREEPDLPEISAVTRTSLRAIARMLSRIARDEGARRPSVAILLVSGGAPGPRTASDQRPRIVARIIASSGKAPGKSSVIRLDRLSFEPSPPRSRASGRPRLIPDPLAARSSRAGRAALAVPIRRGKCHGGLILLRGSRDDLVRLRQARESAIAVAGILSRALFPALPRRGPIGSADLMLGSQEQFFEKIIQASPDAIVAADRAGTILLFNAGAERISGYRARQIVGKMNIRELYAPNVAREIMRQLRSPDFGGPGRLDSCVEVLRASDGREVPIQISAAVIRENGEEKATVGVFTDLRDRIRLEEGLRESEELYRVLVDTASRAHQGIILVREELWEPGAILFANEEFCRFTGWSLPELRAMNLADLFAPEGLEIASEVYQAMMRGDPIGPVQRTVLRTKGCGLITVETCTARTAYRGRTAIIGYCRDVTEQARMEGTLERQTRALSEKNKALEDAIGNLRAARDDLFEQQKLAELGTFSAGIAHEIRNPLGIVRSHLLRLQEARDDAARDAAIRGIDRQIRRTSDFIEKILSYARPSTPVRRRLDLNRTISMAARYAAQAFPLPAGVEIRREFDSGLPGILGDHTQLQEVFINLVNNAIQAVGAQGTVRLVTAREPDGAVRAEVIDTGPGVPEPIRERIFLPFFTAGKGSKGTGMGLAIARRIVEGHQGRIEAVNPPEGGICLRVILPGGERPD